MTCVRVLNWTSHSDKAAFTLITSLSGSIHTIDPSRYTTAVNLWSTGEYQATFTRWRNAILSQRWKFQQRVFSSAVKLVELHRLLKSVDFTICLWHVPASVLALIILKILICSGSWREAWFVLTYAIFCLLKTNYILQTVTVGWRR